MEHEMKLPICEFFHRGLGQCLEAATIPNHYSAAAILPFRNGAFKIGIRYRMVLDLNSEMLLAVGVRQTLGQRPGLECSIHFKPQIVVQPGSIMLLDDKRVWRSLADFGRGLGRLLEVPLTSVFLE